MNIYLVLLVFSPVLKMNIPLYGDTFEIKDEFFSDDEETTDIKPSIRLPDGDAAIMAVASIMEGYGTDISEQLLTEFKYVTKFVGYSIFLYYV